MIKVWNCLSIFVVVVLLLLLAPAQILFEPLTNIVGAAGENYNLTVNVTPAGKGNVTINSTITPSSYPNTTNWS